MRNKATMPLLVAAYSLAVLIALYCGLNDWAYSRVLFVRTQQWVPIQVSYGNTISGMNPAAKASGLQMGDAVLAVNGVPFTSWHRVLPEFVNRKAGDVVPITVRRNGQPVTIAVKLPSFGNPRANTSLLLFGIFIQIIFPTICAGIGIWVLLSRPQDPAAWWVCGILQFMVSFFGMQNILASPATDFQRYFQQFSGSYMIVSALMLGLTFPARVALDRKAPWLKWIVIVLTAILLALDLLEVTLQMYAVRGYRWIPRWLVKTADHTELGLMMVCISLLCACISINYFTAKTADAKRRLRVLLIGSQIGLWPSFICVILAAVRGVDPNRALPFWLFIAALSVLPLFPLSLAYSIVVERAMDVRILVRQGTRYALARGGLWVIQALLAAGMAVSIQHVVRHPDHSRSETVGLLVLTALFFAVRLIGKKRARVWIDRKFFREQYSTEQILSELSVEAGRFTETRPLLETISRRIADTLHVNGVAVFLRSGNAFRLQTSEGLALPSGFMLPESSQAVTELELAHKPATIYFDRPEDWLVEASDAERAALRDLHAEVLLPLPGRGRLMGVMALGPKRSEAPYSKTDLQLLTSVGAQTGLAVENSMLISTLADEAASRAKLNREIEIAREVQERLFPQTFPEVSGVEMAAHCRPAQAVGGDYYDVIAIRDGELMEAGHAPGEEIVSASGAPESCQRLGIAIGDVSGKGISAALLMASLRASLRSQTLGGGGDLAAKMANVNTLLYDASDSNRYATFFFAELDCESRVLHYVNAGHNPPAVLRNAEGRWQVFRLEDGGPVVGLIPGAVYTQQALQLQAGDIFLGYTDGISEAMNPAEDEWGEDRMIAEAEVHAHMNAADLLGHLFLAADAFAAGAPQHDDMTLVVMRLS